MNHYEEQAILERVYNIVQTSGNVPHGMVTDCDDYYHVVVEWRVPKLKVRQARMRRLPRIEPVREKLPF